MANALSGWPQPGDEMTQISGLSALLAVAALLVFMPVTFAGIWHVIIWIVSAGLVICVMEAHGDLDTGFVALGVFIFMLSGLALCFFVGLGWALALTLALPLLGTIGFLMIRREQH